MNTTKEAILEEFRRRFTLTGKETLGGSTIFYSNNPEKVEQWLSKKLDEVKDYDWWGDWKGVHAHSIGKDHWIGSGYRVDCGDCNLKWGEVEK